MKLYGVVEFFTQVITYLMIFAGVPTCVNMLRTKDTYGVPYPFFLAGSVNAVMSIGYGVLVDNSTFIQINSIASLVNAFCIGSYLYASSSKSRPFTQLMACCGAVFCIFVYLTRVVSPDNITNSLGSVLLVITTILLLTPLLQVRECITDKTAAGVSLFMLTCSTLCCSSWTMYGLLLKDFFIYGPNIIGIGTSLCTWAVVAIYGKSRPKGHVE